MGCGNSTQEKEPTSVVVKKQKVSIHIDIERNVVLREQKPQIIVVFGGPGSRKGKLLDDLSHVYGIKLLSIEMIILEELAKKLPPEETDDLRKTAQIAQLLKGQRSRSQEVLTENSCEHGTEENMRHKGRALCHSCMEVPCDPIVFRNQPELMRLHWIMNQVGNALDRLPKNGCYMIDFMPNLKFLLAAFNGITECDNEFKVFENRYPISFAIDFSVKSVKKQLEPQCAVPTKTEPKGKEKAASAQPKQSDEADTGRLAKRANLYNNCAKLFVDFFHKTDRMVTVDVTSRAEEEIWEKVCDFFSQLQLIHLKNTSTVMFFMFGKKDLEIYQVEHLGAERVNVTDMAVDITAPPERIIPAICKFIDDAFPTKKKFIIDVDQSSITKDCMKKDPKKVLQFRDLEECSVNMYIPMNVVSKTPLPSVKALCSSENEVCLFPRDTPHNLCKYIAGLYRAYQELLVDK